MTIVTLMIRQRRSVSGPGGRNASIKSEASVRRSAGPIPGRSAKSTCFGDHGWLT